MMTLRRLCFQMSLWQRGAAPYRARGRRAVLVMAALALPGVALLATRATRADDPAPAALAAKQEAPTTGPVMAPMAVYWKYTGTPFGNNPASPVIDGDTVYFASGKIIYAVDAPTGGLKWRYPAEMTATLPVTVTTTPVVANGTLFVGAGDGLYAFSTTDGKQLWHFATTNGGVNTSPVVVGDSIYFSGQNGHFFAVNIKTGDSLGGIWKPNNRPGLDAGGDVKGEVSVANGMLYYVTGNDILHAVDLTTGIQRWAQRIGEGSPVAMPVLSGENMYEAVGGAFYNWRSATGQQRWRITLPDNAAVPPVADADGNAYVVTTERYVYAINSGGRGIWRQIPRLDYEPKAQPIISGNLLIVPTAQGGLYAFDTTTGALKWNYVVQPSSTNPSYVPNTVNIAAKPVISGGTLYVLSDDGALTAFRHDAPDNLPPTVSEMDPKPGDYLSGRPPFHIGAKIADEGSGIDLSTLHVMLDKQEIPRRPQGVEVSDKDSYLFNPDDNSIDYSTFENATAGRSTALPDGHHTVTIQVKDWMGNQLTKIWTFTIDDSIPRRARKASGTQGNQSPYNSGGNSGGGKGNSGFGGG